ncbi:ABC transporter permease subunit [Nesterenkonia sp. K-15-9-6]|uniref:ABC transporter permease subunit n=1 Tax=Nesterenkonia sp. K-15-9-6 TaxID=3093918 RepID=UPI0040448305
MTPETSAAAQHPRLNTANGTAPRPTRRQHDVDPTLKGLSHLRVLSSELQKILTMRAAWWLGVGALLLVLLFAWISAISLSSMLRWQQEDPLSAPPERVMRDMALETPLTGLAFAAILVGCIGVIAITSEHATGSLRSSLAAVPRRTLLYTAKGLAVALVLGALTAVLILGILLIAVPTAATHGLAPDLTAGETWHRLITHWAGVVLAGLIGFGLGAVLRSTAGGIVTLAILLFVLPMSLEILLAMAGDSALIETLHRWQFANLMTSFTVPDPQLSDQMSTLTAGLGMVAWTAAATVAGGLLFRRRDA